MTLRYPLEVIVINDKSTDKTGEMVDKFAKIYDFIKTFI
ncbi:glycosyltransferase [Psychrobacillus psychrodurans]